jgi:hypothetical protein
MCINLSTTHFLKTIRKNMRLAKGNIYDEVKNLFESVYRIYE